MSVLAGKVTSITGVVQAKNPLTGEVKILKVGDEVLLGDTIVTSIDGNVTITLENGDLLTLGRDTQMALDEDVVGAPGMTDPVTEGAVDVAALQQAVLEGNFEGLEETAAGDTGPAGSANAGANSVDRIGAEGEVTSGYDTSTATTSSTFTQEQAGITEVDVVLTADPQQITEDETLITYTATLDNPAITDMHVTLDNGVIITIPAGELSGSADFFQTPDSDVYIEADSVVVAEIVTTSGGGFDVVNVTNDASTTIVDSINEAIVSLSATESTSEDGGSIVYTATLSDVTNNDVAVALDNGEVITILAGNISGSSDPIAVNRDADIEVVASGDIYIEDDSISAAITGVTESNAGSLGAFETLTFDATPVTTKILDDNDAVTLDLTVSQIDTITEEVTFSAELSNPGQTDVTVTTEHGDILIAAGDTLGTIQVAIGFSSEVSTTVSNVTGGNFEAVEFSGATASVSVAFVVEAVDKSGMPNFNAGSPVTNGTLSGKNFQTTSTSDYGTFSINPISGVWTFELNNNLSKTNELEIGEVKNEVFEVDVDGNTEYVIVKVIGANDTPDAQDDSYTRYDTNSISGINLADKTTDVEDDSNSIITKIKITDLPEFGDLYDADGNVLAVGDEVLDTADLRYTIDPSIDLTPSFNAKDDFKDENGDRIANNTVSSITLVNGLVISGGTFSGARPVVDGESDLANPSDTVSDANLYYDSANRETGLGVGRDKELNSSNKEFISIEFPHEVTNADLAFGSVYGNYQDDHRADAQINVIALKDGKVVSEFSFNDTHNGSGEVVLPVAIDSGYDELRVFTLADRNSNITFQGVEVANMTVEDSFDYDAVDSEGASEEATVDLNISTVQENFKHFIEYDKAGRAPEGPEIPASLIGEKIVINNFDGAEDDLLNLSQIIDGKVTDDTIDQYLKLAFIDENDDGTADTVLLRVDSNGDKAGGELTELYLQNTIGGVDGKDVWSVYAGFNEDTNTPVIGDFDLDD